MQTQTHVFFALALFSRSGQTLRNWAIFAGALATDAFIYIGFLWWVPFKGQDAQTFFRDTYFDTNMQFWSAVSNSLPLYLTLALSGWLIRAKLWGQALLFFALAGLTQSAIDLPVHADDAHRHFWPVSDYRFESPISYWDPNHYGHIVGPMDMVLGLICIVVLWQRFPKIWVRGVLGLFAAAYIAMITVSIFTYAGA